ncbi:MAG: cell division protein ZapB [Deltaproteobacteria bacterium]|nr:cell division protein ZapB [Deltaproteobacteria bacterium]TLN01544.1 MAG: cell division protein ZapB [bacterium]
MDAELFDALETKVEFLLREFSSLKQKNALLVEENEKLLAEREVFKSRIDAILKKMEGV